METTMARLNRYWFHLNTVRFSNTVTSTTPHSHKYSLNSRGYLIILRNVVCQPLLNYKFNLLYQQRCLHTWGCSIFSDELLYIKPIKNSPCDTVQNGLSLKQNFICKSNLVYCLLIPKVVKPCLNRISLFDQFHKNVERNNLLRKWKSSNSLVLKRFYSNKLYANNLKQEVNMNKLINYIPKRNSIHAMEKPKLHPITRTESSHQSAYKTSIELLNQLQTNAEYIKQAVEIERSSNICRSLEKIAYFLSLIGIKPEDLNKLNVIHIAGTKGKGSTCAFVESILRKNGFKTGFYSSPHLVVARERIRINGKPISEEKFAKYFIHVYNIIRSQKSADYGMPSYFSFLTIMTFHIFLKEQVDAAILEVGIGGEYDCTNIVPKPVVTGITSLDLDHCKLLGDKIEQIAWQKSGIFKNNVPAFTVKQNSLAMEVLLQRALKKNSPFFVVPAWQSYPNSSSIKLGTVQKLNASLAVQMAHHWINNHSNSQYKLPAKNNVNNIAEVFPLNANNYSDALSETKWLGRCEIIDKQKIVYFLDAAHTPDSMLNCSNWFFEESNMKSAKLQKCDFPIESTTKYDDKVYRVLVFNCTGERKPETLLTNLSRISFNEAIFTTNCIRRERSLDSDTSNLTVTSDKEKKVCQNNLITWKSMQPQVECSMVNCITESIEVIKRISETTELPVHVLITGSLHLVGGFIGLLHPDFVNDKNQNDL